MLMAILIDILAKKITTLMKFHNFPPSSLLTFDSIPRDLRADPSSIDIDPGQNPSLRVD